MSGDTSLHQWVYQYLLAMVQLGAYQRGERLPSMDALKKLFGVSEKPIRQAMERLLDEGYILLSRGKTAELARDLTREEWRENCIRYFAVRKEAAIDLCRIRDKLLSALLLAGLRVGGPDNCERVRRYLENTENDDLNQILQAIQQLLEPLGNPLAYKLYGEIALFGRLSFYQRWRREELPPPGNGELGMREGMLILLGWVQSGTLSFAEIQTAMAGYFQQDTRRILTRYQALPPTDGGEPIPFAWNTYRGRPRQIYSVATLLIRRIVEGQYPAEHPLPSVEGLCAEFHASEPTVRRALSLLCLAGVTQPTGGKGHRISRLTAEAVRQGWQAPGIRERMGECLQSLQLLRLLCDILVHAAFPLAERPAAQWADQLTSAAETGNWVNLLVLFGDMAISGADNRALAVIAGQLQEYALWLYPLSCFGDTPDSRAVFRHAALTLAHCLREGSETLFGFEMKWILDSLLAWSKQLLAESGLAESAELRKIEGMDL